MVDASRDAQQPAHADLLVSRQRWTDHPVDGPAGQVVLDSRVRLCEPRRLKPELILHLRHD